MMNHRSERDNPSVGLIPALSSDTQLAMPLKTADTQGSLNQYHTLQLEKQQQQQQQPFPYSENCNQVIKKLGEELDSSLLNSLTARLPSSACKEGNFCEASGGYNAKRTHSIGTLAKCQDSSIVSVASSSAEYNHQGGSPQFTTRPTVIAQVPLGYNVKKPSQFKIRNIKLELGLDQSDISGNKTCFVQTHVKSVSDENQCVLDSTNTDNTATPQSSGPLDSATKETLKSLYQSDVDNLLAEYEHRKRLRQHQAASVSRETHSESLNRKTKHLSDHVQNQEAVETCRPHDSLVDPTAYHSQLENGSLPEHNSRLANATHLVNVVDSPLNPQRDNTVINRDYNEPSSVVCRFDTDNNDLESKSPNNAENFGLSGFYPMARYSNMDNLSVDPSSPNSANDIDDILNQTLETIAEESDEEHGLDNRNILGWLIDKSDKAMAHISDASQHGDSTEAEPRSSFNSLNSTPVVGDKFLRTVSSSLPSISNDQKTVSVSNQHRNWDSELNVGELTNSEILSESDYEDINANSPRVERNNFQSALVSNQVPMFDQQEAEIYNDTSSHDLVNRNKQNKQGGNQPVGGNWYDDLEADDLPPQKIRIRWDQVADGLCHPSLVESEALSGSNSTLCADDPDNLSAFGDDVQDQDLESGPRNEEEATVDAREKQEMTSASHTQKSSLVQSTHSSFSQSSREPFINRNRLSAKTDWDSIDLQSEMTESVVLSDYVSDLASVASADYDDPEVIGQHDISGYSNNSDHEDFGDNSQEFSDPICQQSRDTLADSRDYFDQSTHSMHSSPDGHTSFADFEVHQVHNTSQDFEDHLVDAAQAEEEYDDEKFRTDGDQADLCDTGYFSRSQDRDSGLDSSSSPPAQVSPADSGPSADTRITQSAPNILTPFSDAAENEGEPLEGEPEPQPLKPLKRKASFKLSSDETLGSVCEALESADDVGDLPSSWQASDSLSNMASGSFAGRKKPFLRTQSSESIHEPHGDVESITTPWYEDSPLTTPPIKSNRNPFLRADSSERFDITTFLLNRLDGNMRVDDNVDKKQHECISGESNTDTSSKSSSDFDNANEDKTVSKNSSAVKSTSQGIATNLSDSGSCQDVQEHLPNPDVHKQLTHNEFTVETEPEKSQISAENSRECLSEDPSCLCSSSTQLALNQGANTIPFDSQDNAECTSDRQLTILKQNNTVLSKTTGPHLNRKTPFPSEMDKHSPGYIDNPSEREQYIFMVDSSEKCPQTLHSSKQESVKFRFKIDTNKSIKNSIEHMNSTTTEGKDSKHVNEKDLTYDKPTSTAYQVHNSSTKKAKGIDKDMTRASPLLASSDQSDTELQSRDTNQSRDITNSISNKYVVETQNPLDATQLLLESMNSANPADDNTTNRYISSVCHTDSDLGTMGSTTEPLGMVKVNKMNSALQTSSGHLRDYTHRHVDSNTKSIANPQYFGNITGKEALTYSDPSIYSRDNGNRKCNLSNPLENQQQCKVNSSEAFAPNSTADNLESTLRNELEQRREGHIYENDYNSSKPEVPFPRRPPKAKEATDCVKHTRQDITSNILSYGSLHDPNVDNPYENVVVAYREPRRVTAQATSTALARKDFRLTSQAVSGEDILTDSVVSAVASAEATGENPYIAVARATARAASLATASASQTITEPGANEESALERHNDNRDITIMISTSCTIHNDDSTSVRDSARDVLQALNHNANVAVYTRLAPAPKALLGQQPLPGDNTRKLRVSIDQSAFDVNAGQPVSDNCHSKAVEISIPEGLPATQLVTMVTEAVNKILSSVGAPISKQEPYSNKHKQLAADRNGGSDVLSAYDTTWNQAGKDAINKRGQDVKGNQADTRQPNHIATLNTGCLDICNANISVNPSVSTSGAQSHRTNIGNHSRKDFRDTNANNSDIPDVFEQTNRESSKIDSKLALRSCNDAHSTSTYESRSRNRAEQRRDQIEITQHLDESKRKLMTENGRLSRDLQRQSEINAYRGQIPVTKPSKMNGLGEQHSTVKTNSSYNEDSTIQRHHHGTMTTPTNSGPGVSTSRTDGKSIRPINQSQIDSGIESVNLHRGPRPIDKDFGQNNKQVFSSVQLDRPKHQADSTPNKAALQKSGALSFKLDSTPLLQPDKKTTDYFNRAIKVTNLPPRQPSPKLDDLKSQFNHPLEATRNEDIDRKWHELKSTGYKATGTKYNGSSIPADNSRQSIKDTAARKHSSAEDKHKPKPRRPEMVRLAARDGLARAFYTADNARCFTETDMDTGHTVHQPFVQETDIDRKLAANARAASVDNLRKGHNASPNNTSPPREVLDGNNQVNNFEKTQSMSCLLNKAGKPHGNAEAANRYSSPNAQRIHNSLGKLNVPDWYSGSTQISGSADLLHNTRCMSSGSPNRQLSPTPISEGVSARIVTTKPVVIQHRVMTPNMRKSPQPMEQEQFKLPSSKWRQKEGAPFKPVPLRALHDLNTTTKTPSANQGHNNQKLNVQVKNDNSQHDYVNLSGLQGLSSDTSEDTPPPLPPRRAPAQNWRENPTNQLSHGGSYSNEANKQDAMDGNTGPMKENIDQRAETMQTISVPSPVTSRPSVTFDTRPTFHEPDSSAGYAHENSTDSRALHTLQTSTRSCKTVASSDPLCMGQTNHNSNMDENGINYFNDRLTPYSNLRTNIRDDPVFDRARQSSNKLVSSFAEDIKQCLELEKYDESPKRRRLPVVPVANLESGSTDEVFKLNSKENVDVERSYNATKSDLSLDEILTGLQSIPPSLSTSISSQSRRGAQRSGSADIGSSQSLESPQERLFRLLRETATPGTHLGDSSLDSSIGKGPDSSPQVLSPRESHDSSLNNTNQSSNCDTSLNNSATNPDIEVDDTQVVVKCRNTKCKRQMNLRDARHSYKTCHNCFTYYCSRECRQAHWERHKRKCLFSRVSSHCKHVIKKVHDDPNVCEEFSRIARTGYIQKGRGCVVVVFTYLEQVTQFVEKGITALQTPLSFVSLREIEESQLFTDQLYELVEMCRTYNPEVKFIADSIIITSTLPQTPPTSAPLRKEGSAIKKCAKLRLTNSQKLSTQKKSSSSSVEDADTLILTAVPGSEFTENMEEKKAREICFANIQRKLRQRGISLRHQYPDVYNKLCAYVATQEHFAPITLFPTDSNTGKRFMCLIMPNSEPEIEWLNNPGLLDELGLNNDL